MKEKTREHLENAHDLIVNELGSWSNVSLENPVFDIYRVLENAHNEIDAALANERLEP